MLDLLFSYKDVFEVKPVDLNNPTNVKLILKPHTKPIQKENKLLNERVEKFFNSEVECLLRLGVISISDSLYNISPTFPTKANGDLRFTLNLIPINELFELV